jgi:hypothetical protein
MSSSSASRVQKRRSALRASGLRPLQIWVPDTRRPDLVAECRRQAGIVTRADLQDVELAEFMDAAGADVSDLAE